MVDTVLIAQYHIQELRLEVNSVNTEISNIHKESVRFGQLFNRINTLIWDCLTVCGLESFIVSYYNQSLSLIHCSLLCRIFHFHILTVRIYFGKFSFFSSHQQLDWYDGPYFNHLMQQFQQSEKMYKENIQKIENLRIYTKVTSDNETPK